MQKTVENLVIDKSATTLPLTMGLNEDQFREKTVDFSHKVMTETETLTTQSEVAVAINEEFTPIEVLTMAAMFIQLFTRSANEKRLQKLVSDLKESLS